MLRKILVAAIAGATASITVPVLAQDDINEIQVVSVNRTSQGLGDVNAAVSVIGSEELGLIKHTHFQEALSRLPGISTHRNNGQESLLAIRSPVLTGAGACGSFLVAENGIPVRANGFCNVNEMFDTNSENAQRIELVRGPGSALWGSNAVHGLINVILPEAGDVGRIRLEAGPWGSTRVNGAYGHDYGNFKQTLLFNGTNEDGYRDDSGVDQQKLAWLYQYTTANGGTLDGGFSIINLNQETAGFVVGTDAFEGSQRDTNPNPEAFRDSVNSRVWTRYSTEVDGWDLQLTPYFREVNMTFVQHFLPGQPIEDTEHRSLGIQVAGARTLDDGSRLALGLDIENTSGNLLQFQPLPTVGSFFLRNSIPQGRHYDYEVDSRQIGAYVNYEKSLSDRWQLALGLRYEDMSYNYDNQMIDGRTDQNGVPCRFGCRYSRPSDRSDGFGNFSPKIGLSYDIDDNNQLQFRLQKGFRAPQATEMYRLQNAQTVADLDSVELDSYELAITGANAQFNYSATVYYMDKQNEIFQNSARENTNDSHTRHRGLEFAFGYDINDSLTLSGVYNYALHSYENSLLSGGVDVRDNDIDTAPRQFGNVRLQWRPTSALTTELEIADMGKYYTNPENTASYEGHTLFNLRSIYQVSDDVALSLNVLNLADEEYAERADWTTFTGDRYFPGEPARAYFAVEWNFK